MGMIRSLLPAAAVGIGAGAAVSLFRYGIVHLSEGIRYLYAQVSEAQDAQDVVIRAAVLLFVMLLFSALVSFALKREPLIGGSGIPQVVGYLDDRIHMKWHRILIYKLFGGILSIGSGLTVGREGPSVQVGAAVGQGVGEMMTKTDEHRKLSTVAGACSGIAVAFNTPISSLAFAYEELRLKPSPKNFMFLSVAIVISNFISVLLFGHHPIIELTLPAHDFQLFDYAALLLTGILAGVSGVMFNALIVFGKRLYQRVRLHEQLKILFPFLISFAFILYSFEYYGSGEHFIFLPFHENVSIWKAMQYYGVTLFLLLAAFCSGLPGGIFFPMLVLGSLLGNIIGLSLSEIGLISVEMIPLISVITMAAHFSAIVRSPLTGMLLVVEMTGALRFMLPLVIVSLLAYATAERMRSEPIYESLLKMWMRR